MKALVTRKSMFIASISVTLALITIIFVNIFSSYGPVTGFANTVTRPIRALASVVAHTFENIYASIYRYDNLMADYEDLLRRLAQYQLDYYESAELAAENQQLREWLGFRDRQPGMTTEMASNTGWSGSNWDSSFEINLGYANSNIARGYGVATEYDVLIGQVIEVGALTSTVITVLDTKFSAAAFVGGDATGEGGSGGEATVKGDFAYMRNGLLILDNIDDDISILPGAYVTTSGAGGVFPRGLIIGEVEHIFRHPSGIGRFATVKPLRDIDTLQTLFVITAFQATD
jgi:rod shape-determining protein MreC